MYMYIIEMKKIEFFNNQMFKMILVFRKYYRKYYLFCFVLVDYVVDI